MTTRIRAVSVESWGKNLIEVSSKAKGEEELKIACKDNYFKEFCYKREKKNKLVAGGAWGSRWTLQEHVYMLIGPIQKRRQKCMDMVG